MKKHILFIALLATAYSIQSGDAPIKRVRMSNVIPSTNFPFLMHPYLPVRIAESKKASGEWSHSVNLALSPSGVSDAKYRLILWFDELYLMRFAASELPEGAESKFPVLYGIDPYTNNILTEDGCPSADTSTIQYFENIETFEEINNLMHRIAHALRIKIATNPAKPFLKTTFNGVAYRIHQADDNNFYISPKDGTGRRPKLLLYFLFAEWVLSPFKTTLHIQDALMPATASCRCVIS
jgi:hypothetical protein